MKKLKVLMGALALIAAMALVGCNQPTSGADGNGGTGATNPSGGETGGRSWERAINNGAALTDNGDGTATAILSSNYSGIGVVVYINQDKTSVAAGANVKVEFDYETVQGKWTDNSLNPKFKVQLAKGGTTYYDTTKAQSDNEYFNMDTKSGTFSQTFTASDAANELLIQFNAYNWAAGADVDDQIKVKIKSITVE